ncbi:hypothetical protein WOC12_00940 [Vibrio parahaemolyticus]|uniref:hypothetical protein n=1 Tax=Vibrio parahaemolyticus TaxID=670 RepID=UPI00081BDDF2|nr:hypothetical protein [Vibrio parahaemolyticus]EJC1445943.1 hypothetical protein [Vibrio parahaemolyticus]EJE4209226.1 hypothetical protein [Vibrio parahaemolyticus]
MTSGIPTFLQDRYPSDASIGGTGQKTNNAIKLYGRRLYKDQTPVEYLAELLLVFLSAKTSDGKLGHSFQLDSDDIGYYPENRIALKLFSFYPTSKLETRHTAHQDKYIEALSQVKAQLNRGTDEQKDDTIRILQSLFSGFTGVAKNRTWVTHSFLPVAPSLISREVAWRHKEAQKDNTLDWNACLKYFDTGSHLFMARGGELLFLQLAHLFTLTSEEFNQKLNINVSKEYHHLTDVTLHELQLSLESALSKLLKGSLKKVEQLSSFIEVSLRDVTLNKAGEPKTKKATLGWVPRASIQEAFLFATELNNICESSLSELEKLEMMQLLCCLHVLRSLSFQAQRLSQPETKMQGFIGNYAWVVSAPDAPRSSASRRLSQSSFEEIESLLYSVLRVVHGVTEPGEEYRDKEADEHGFKIFRKICKEIGLVIPKTGQGQRFVLPPALLRVLVAAVIKPGERVRLTEFYRRVFAHFGIAIASQQLSVAINRSETSQKNNDYAMTTESLWIEEALKQGGFLVELSDAVSIVHNPK